MRRGMLERDAELSALAHAVREAADRHGSVVLVKGEAGIGKSCLVEALRSHLPAEGRMLVGYCDDLATPRTLGPFRDLVGSVGTELSRAVTDGSERDRVLTALRTELTWPEHPTVLVIEDVLVTTFDSLHDMVTRSVGRVYYSFSTFLCVPNALSQDGGYSLGAQAGEESIRRLAGDAGYTGFRRVAETPFNIIYEVRP